MCHQKQDAPRNPDQEAFIESVLRVMDQLAEEAGDWRIHLPYEAMLDYRKDSAVQEQYADHFNACAFCQEAVDTLNPPDKS